MTYFRAVYSRQRNDSNTEDSIAVEAEVEQEEEGEDEEEEERKYKQSKMTTSTSSTIPSLNSIRILNPSTHFFVSMKTIYIFGGIFLLLLLSFLLITNYILISNCKVKNCLSSECIQISSSLLSSMDFSIDPCDDFYEYACGGWKKNNPIPDGRSSWSTFEKLWERNQLILRNLLLSNSSSREGAEEKAKKYFLSCLDTHGNIESLKGRPLIELLEKELGGLSSLLDQQPQPQIRRGNEDSQRESVSEFFDFQKTIQQFQNDFHFGGFFIWSIGENERNSSSYIIIIDQGGLSLPSRDYYFKNDSHSKDVLSSLSSMMFILFKLLLEEGREEPLSKEEKIHLKDKVQDIIQLEIQIANITVSFSERREEKQHYYTIKDLNSHFDFLNWTKYFENAFERINVSLSIEDSVSVISPNYLEQLSKLIADYSQKSNKSGNVTLNNYFLWNAVRTLRATLSKSYRDSGALLQKALLGKESMEERWRSCVTDVDGILGYALGAMFVKKAFTAHSKDSAQKMISAIKESFKDSLKNISWMDSETKEKAIEKANAISDMIGYPNYILNAEELNEKYKEFKVSESEYFQNNIRYMEFNFYNNLHKLLQPVNSSQWSMTPPTVNAYYTPSKNQIVFPAGLLQIPFFNPNSPQSLNFGAMGVVMGHELSHAFDDQGREYDKYGNMVSWWKQDTLNKFKKKLECMKDQYSNFSLHSEKLNGKQTLGENIADNGGLKASYNAYHKWLDIRKHEEDTLLLPGINLTNSQLFFLSFSQVWCSSSTEQADHLQLLEDAHSPGKYRVIGSLSNSIEFSKAFECPSKSRMNPVKKCHVW